MDHEKTTIEIDLINDKTIYVVKDGQLITHELLDYGETVVITMGGMNRLETTQKRILSKQKLNTKPYGKSG